MSVIRHEISRGKAAAQTMRRTEVFATILLIAPENDARLIEPFLRDNSFGVHLAERTSEALEEAMNREFDVIIFDTALRDFALTTFYSALEKIRPQLLSRFVFLVDENTDEWLKEFIERIDGWKVWRPIELPELLQMIEIVRGRGTAARIA